MRDVFGMTVVRNLKEGLQSRCVATRREGSIADQQILSVFGIAPQPSACTFCEIWLTNYETPIDRMFVANALKREMQILVFVTIHDTAALGWAFELAGFARLRKNMQVSRPNYGNPVK